MELKEAINRRHSTRSFKRSKAPLKDVFDVLESVLHAPMAGNVCTVRLILVEDADLKSNLAEASPDNEFITDAGHVVVVCSDLKKAKILYEEKGQFYAAQQAGAAIQNLLLTAESLGIASCWTSSFDESAVKRYLEIPDDFRVEAIIPLGNELNKPEKKRKVAFKEVVYYNKFGTKKQEFIISK